MSLNNSYVAALLNMYSLIGVFFAVGGVLEFELMRRRKETPVLLQNFFDMWREDGWDTPGNYGFGKIFVFDENYFIQNLVVY